VETGAELTRWTVWLAVAAYSVRVALSLAGKADDERGERVARWIWTTGCVLVWAHVACAFEFVHHWSHESAYSHTARETAGKIGIAWGGGIFFNYLFMLLWAGDVLWWWRQPASYRRRPLLIAVALHAYLAFILFNATVVFKDGWVRYVGLGITLGLVTTAICVLLSWKRDRRIRKIL
jgi:hypothetical protein